MENLLLFSGSSGVDVVERRWKSSNWSGRSSDVRGGGALVEDVELEIYQADDISVVVAIFATVNKLITIEGD